MQLRKLGSRLGVPLILCNYDGFYTGLMDFLVGCDYDGVLKVWDCRPCSAPSQHVIKCRYT